MTRVFYLSGKSADLPQDRDWLTPAEREVVDRLRFEKRRNDWLVGRWVAKRALAAAVGTNGDLSRWQVLAAADGAPEVWRDGVRSDLALSISHSNGVALAAVAPLGPAIGCDLELIEPRDEQFVETFLTRRERLELNLSGVAERPAMTTLIWSAKESALKMMRKGLKADTWSIEVDVPKLELPGRWQPLFARSVDGERTFHGWWRHGERFIATIMADRSPHVPIDLNQATPDS